MRAVIGETPRRLAALAGLVLLSACGGQPQQTPPPPAVDIITVAPSAVTNVIELPGRVQAVRTAEVRARVDGIVERRLYEEGTDVGANQPLFRIDPRQNQASYNSAAAALARAEAGAANARAVVGRYAPLVKQQAISNQEYDAAVAQARQFEADVASARAALDRARLDLNYTLVTSPIAGRAGRAQVTEGALVSAGSATLMTTVEQLDPVYVNFSQSSSELLQVRRQMSTGAIQASNLDRVSVTLILEDGSTYAPAGHLDFLDMAVDESTGTVSLRAEFPNRQRILLPGQFVRARVEAGINPNGILVPQRAVQISQQGAAVVIVGPNNIATARPIKVGNLQGNSWVVTEGLKTGDRVIVNGLQKVRPGQPVTISPPAGQAAGQPGTKPGAKPATAPATGR
ncbi:membrane fusion protein, multidrug efflux system [Sphingomonas laterariae]|uniref:Membrane fusion protein, multidrug efflux system n=1 Tax=Edaphosphingomonas laterariae TaxID=861865 RepID=A0A239FNL8_9SPHN|nr:efflux RND transporter periplasmic adaptor subunit [Sphingomonas laterariae]SNS58218.1 membrane fusion protein, multidrug efflux system [Sphingomonas laterariae]